jgi:hypothetical protein
MLLDGPQNIGGQDAKDGMSAVAAAHIALSTTNTSFTRDMMLQVV